MPEFDYYAYLANPENREKLAMHFLPETLDERGFPRKSLDIIAENLLSSAPSQRAMSKFPESPEEAPDTYVDQKKHDLADSAFMYSRIFELCRVLGCRNIYDIGCQRINQSFQLIRYSSMSYTGISPWGFDLNDYQKSDYKDKNYKVYSVKDAPKPFCGGRIRFFKGYYPRDKFEILPDNIAVACYSFTMLRDETEIRETVRALTQDFDRVLFNLFFQNHELIGIWKSADWSAFEVYPIGPQGFLFATKHHEDIERMQKVYPFDDGRFITGIDDSSDYFYDSLRISEPDPFEYYVNW